MEHSLLSVPSLPLSPDSHIRVRSITSLSAMVVTIRATIARADGSIFDFERQVTPNGNRGISVDIFHIGEGHLISCSAFTARSQTRRGNCYVNLSLQLGSLAAEAPHTVLIADYVEVNNPVTWPHSTPRSSIDGAGFSTATAMTIAGSGLSALATVPSNTRWRFYALQAILETSGVASNRRPRLSISENSLTTYDVITDTAITANTSAELTWAHTGGAFTDRNDNFFYPMPHGLITSIGGTISMALSGSDAGDEYTSAFIHIEEWLELSGGG